jgi:hyaluronan synthase
VLVTIDSDSVIDPAALLALAGALRDRRVGAAGGKVAVLHREQGLIPRMLAVRFVLSFDFLRAVQSTHGTVYCCPGALAAYRASAVRPVAHPLALVRLIFVIGLFSLLNVLYYLRSERSSDFL